MACIEIEIDDHLDDASEYALREEIERRLKKGQWKGALPKQPGGEEAWSHADLAHDLRTAFYARNASRFETLLQVLEQAQVPMKAAA